MRVQTASDSEQSMWPSAYLAILISSEGGAMPTQKLKPREQSVNEFLDSITDRTRRAECHALLGIMKRVTHAEPKIWGSGLVGFGNYHYKYASGHEGDCFVAGFAPRKGALTL